MFNSLIIFLKKMRILSYILMFLSLQLTHKALEYMLLKIYAPHFPSPIYLCTSFAFIYLFKLWVLMVKS